VVQVPRTQLPDAGAEGGVVEETVGLCVDGEVGDMVGATVGATVGTSVATLGVGCTVGAGVIVEVGTGPPPVGHQAPEQ